MWTRLLLCTVCLLHPLWPTVYCTASFQVSLPLCLCTWARTLTAHLIRYTCLSLACPSERTKYSAESGAFCCQLLSFFLLFIKTYGPDYIMAVLVCCSSSLPGLCDGQYVPTPGSRPAEACSYSVDASFPPGCVEVRVSLLGFIDSYCWKNISKQ